MDELFAAPEELLEVVEKMFPREFDRARAELTIVKQRRVIEELTRENASLKPQPEHDENVHRHDEHGRHI